jgi:hypothetical protein
MEPAWNPAVDAQALARVWRDGQTRRTHVYRLVTAWSVEERVLQRQLLKGDMASAMGYAASGKGGARAAGGGGGGGGGALFSAAELRALFAMDPTGGVGAGEPTPASCDTAAMLLRSGGGGGGAARPSLADAPWPAYGGAAAIGDAALRAAAEAARLPEGPATVAFVRTVVHNEANAAAPAAAPALAPAGE